MDKTSAPGMETLVPVASLEEFFRDSVDAALAANRVVVDRDTSYYVVRLLTLFARTDGGEDPAEGGSLRRPLALLLAEAVDAGSRAEQRVALQRLGDISLFTAGFFSEALQARPVGLDYYVNMGGGAYRTLANTAMGSTRGRALAEVFAELAAKFLELVDVLHEVRDSARGSRDHDILRLYENWLRTGSRRAARLLRQAGLEPAPHSFTAWQH